MAAKKFYVVKKGRVTGIFTEWAKCKEAVDGFPGAEYKGFASRDEAVAYLNSGKEDRTESIPNEEGAQKKLLVYVDGSYDDSIKKYAFGCVFLPYGEKIRIAFGNGDNPDSLKHRNVTGEMLGAMFAVKTAMVNGYTKVEICYDYEGIEKWVTGSWRSKTALTQLYAKSMQEWGKSIAIEFTKVAAHSNIKYNELADVTAKRGLTEGSGIPRITRLEELEVYAE